MSKRRRVPRQTSGRRVVVVPSQDELVDAGALSGLVIIALYGFSTTFAGVQYLLVGIAGLALGLLVAHIANVLRQPFIAVAAMAVAAFFLLGGAIALRGGTIAGVLPTGTTFHGLADNTVHGWKDLLTTLPPVDASGPLLVLPYLMGLVAGAGGLCLAQRVRAAVAPLFAPLAVLVAVILLGTQTPPARVMQGAVFGVVALGWAAARSARNRPVVQSGSGRVTRLVTAGALLAAAGGLSWAVAPHVPGFGSHSRTVLRSYVDPPFDIGQYASPLAAFRAYTKPAKQLYDQELLDVDGLPAMTRLRIATLDAYDGSTWRASNTPAVGESPASTFQRVGSTIDQPAHGTSATFTVTIKSGYRGPWLPDAGAMAGIAFHGADASDHAGYFRLDLATGTGVVPNGLSDGDSYTVHAVLPAVPDLRATDVVATAGALADEDTSFLKTQAERWSADGPTPTAKVFAVATFLRTQGKYSDGGTSTDGIYLPGHSLYRLNQFVNGIAGNPQIVGDDEQYASTYALILNQLGTPARVVLGATPTDNIVRGRDVHAWVEVQLADGTWRTMSQSTFMNTDAKPSTQPPKQPLARAGKIVPPPARVRPPSSVDDADAAASRSSRHTPTQDPPQSQDESSGPATPAWVATAFRWGGPPVGIVLLVVVAIVGVKALRRRRRRRRGSPATRVSGGWRELLDHARDLGAVPIGRTRREQASALDDSDLTALASIADARIFGPADPVDDTASDYWREVDAARKKLSRDASLFRRARAAVSPTSLRKLTDPTGGAA